MKTIDILKMALLNLYRRLSRTALTIVGVVIGTACIVIMVSIGLTNLTQFEEMMNDSNLERIEVYSSGDSAFNTLSLDSMAIQAFTNLENVDYVVPQYSLPFYASIQGYYAPYISIIAVPAEYLLELIEVEEGVSINPSSSMVQLVMGEGLYKRFIKSENDNNRNYSGPGINFLDSTIELALGGEQVFNDTTIPLSRIYKATVVGIIKNEQEEYKNNEIYMSIDIAKKILQENYKTANALNLSYNNYESVYVYANDIENVKDILNVIRSYGFQAFSNTEWIDEMKRQQQAQQGQLLAIGLISLIVSAIGIANTMMMSIIERKQEIGVMKVIGISIRRIRSMFLIESAIIGASGGFIGCIIAHLFSLIIVSGGEEMSFLGMYFQKGMKFVMPLWLDISAIGIAIIVGVIAGFLPARRATMLSPLEAIRG